MKARSVATAAGALLVAGAAWLAWDFSAGADAGVAAADVVTPPASPGSGVGTIASPAGRSSNSDSANDATAVNAAPPMAVDPVHDPDGDAKLLAYFQALVSRIYGDAREELGLDAAQTEALLALLVEQKLRESSLPLPDSREDVEAFAAVVAQFERELDDQLGPARARRFTEYRRTENARYEVDDLSRDLESSQLPLTDAQRKSMIRTAIDRGAYVTRPPMDESSLGLAALQEYYARFEQRDQQMLIVARGILDPAQFAIMERSYANRQRAYDEMLRNAEKHPAR